MNKNDVDRYFTSEYENILIYIKKMFSKYSINEKPEFFLSEIYLYIIKNIDKIVDSIELRKYISTFIHNNCYWNNSTVREAEIKSRSNKNIEFDSDKYSNIEDSVDDCIEDELLYDEYKIISELYYKSLKSVEKKIVWEIYFVEGMNNTRKFSEYIGKSKTIAYGFIKGLRDDMKLFYDEYRKNNPLDTI